jgi:hypothetical protein
MALAPYFADMAVDANGKRYVTPTKWDQMMDNFINWKFSVNGGGNTLSNVVIETVGGVKLHGASAVPEVVLYNGGGVSEWSIRQKSDHSMALARYVAGTYTDLLTLSAVGVITFPNGSFEVGSEVSGGSFVDFHTRHNTSTSGSWTDYAARIFRNEGDNGNFQIMQRGSGSLDLLSVDAGWISLYTNNIARATINSDGLLTANYRLAAYNGTFDGGIHTFPPGQWSGYFINYSDNGGEGAVVIGGTRASEDTLIMLVGSMNDVFGAGVFHTFFSIDGIGQIFMPHLRTSTSYTDDAAASAGGVALGQLYRNGSQVMIRVS